MRRKRELQLLRKKRLLKKYSDFELSLLASEMNDYIYLLKSINFPKEELKIPEKTENKNSENNEEIKSKNNDTNIYEFKKLYSFGNKDEHLEDIKESEEDESEEEYGGLRPKNIINEKIKKRK